MSDRKSQARAIASAESLARAPGTTYRLLGRLWREEPDAHMLRWLCTEPARSAYHALSGYSFDFADALCEELQAAYCTAFVLPRTARPPVQSVFERDQYQSDIASDVTAFYELVGYEQCRGRYRVPPDHLGIELDCAGYLMALLSETSSTDHLLCEACVYFHERFLSWAERYCGILTASDLHPFYRGLAQATAAAVRLWPVFIAPPIPRSSGTDS